tara:strand:+ start:353 stop:811 length:459 start_codon:yes stop_codon:yes gene_type:complete
MFALLPFLHNVVMTLNSNKFFSGIVMLILNIGSKYITINLSDSQEDYLKNNVSRQILIFAIVFIATKDIYISITLTAAFLVLSDHLFNEESRFYILPKTLKKMNKAIDENDDGDISEKELNHAIMVLTKAKKQKVFATQQKAYELFKSNINQ